MIFRPLRSCILAIDSNLASTHKLCVSRQVEPKMRRESTCNARNVPGIGPCTQTAQPYSQARPIHLVRFAA